MNDNFRWLIPGSMARTGRGGRRRSSYVVAFFCLLLLAAAFPLHAEWHAVFPQFTGGGGWSSDLFITNQGT
ncbi:MAG: hypothetical protein WBN92_10005, partial [Terriglobia bacterium]